MACTEIFPAHIQEKRVQTVKTHCENTAEFAAAQLKPYGLENVGWIAGILHDVGKYTDEYRCYITDISNGIPRVRGSVNHVFAGVKIAEDLSTGDATNDKTTAMITRDLIAYAAGSHHGAFDGVDENGTNGFVYRATKDGVRYEEAIRNFEKCDPENNRALQDRFRAACVEVSALAQKLNRVAKQYYGLEMKRRQHEYTDLVSDQKAAKRKGQEFVYFGLGVIARTVQSVIIDGDRSDTAAFMHGTSPRHLKIDLDSFWEEQLNFAEAKIEQLDQSTEINRARRMISNQCKETADDPDAMFYRLNAPTGSGKTLATLRFALYYAKKWKKKRVIFTAPLLSILKQNANDICDYLKNPEYVLRHYTGVVNITKASHGELNQNELFTENWENPIIITSLVQLLLTFFSSNTTSIRRFYALADAVLVVDEVQTVPTKYLSVFHLMITCLCNFFHTTVVFSSATHPASDAAEYPICVPQKTMQKYDQRLWEVFDRCKIIADKSSCTLREFPDKAEKLCGTAKSVLIICNTKKECAFIYREMKKKGAECFHISAGMCLAHRDHVLQKVQEELKKRRENPTKYRPLYCISTQVLEAGVNLSFEIAIRVLAGLENAIQTAGRCNRNGEYKNGTVYLVKIRDEQLQYLDDIARSKDACSNTIENYSSDNLSSDEAIRDYYENLYRLMDVHAQSFLVNELSLNLNNIKHCISSQIPKLPQLFKTAGDAFDVFDQSTTSVIVPYDKGNTYIEKIQQCDPTKHPFEYRSLLNDLRDYTVNVYENQMLKLQAKDAVSYLEDKNLYILKPRFYDQEIGVVN